MARRTFTRDFRESAARLVIDQGYTVPQAAHSLGVDPHSIRDWVRKLAPIPATSGPLATEGIAALRQENQRLQVENKRLLMEREILKKATAFFAKEQS
jgi:transposase